MGKLTALVYILFDNRDYYPGDPLPSDNEEKVAEWLKSGTAAWIDDEPSTYVRARPAAAQAGLPGLAVGGEVSGNDLIGRVPATHQRKRGHHG